MTEQYRAMSLIAPETLELRDKPLKEPGPKEVLVKVSLAGVCGTDLAIYGGHYQVDLPLVLGHEFCGVVAQVGADISTSWIGRRVAVDINNSCLAYQKEDPCPECKKQMPRHCRTRTVTGIIQMDGAFAEYITVPAQNLHPLPDAISDRAAVLVEPMAAALQTFIMRPLVLDEYVVVLGTGRLGLLIVAAAKSHGAKVIGISRSQVKRDFAKRFGADEILAPSPDLPQQIQEITGGMLADVVVEASGNPEILKDAIELVRPRGTICLKTTAGVPSQIDLTRIIVDEIQLSTSRCGPFAPTIHFLEQHDLPIEDWIQETFPLSQLPQGMEAATQPGKFLISPQQ